MNESLVVIIFLGLFAGFFFSVPIAGPISILITSNALKGRLRYCIWTAIGGAIVEAIYVFVAIYGLTNLYNLYNKAIPIILIIGSLFLIFVGIKIAKTKITLEEITSKKIENDKIKNKGGFRSGILLNLSNPSLFVGWFTSSLLLLSFASSVGLNTGGLDILMYENVVNVEEIPDKAFETLEEYNLVPEKQEIQNTESFSNLVLSLVYAFMVGLGSFIWFYLLSTFLIKFKEKLNIVILNWIIKGLGIILVGIGAFLVYEGIIMII